MGKFERGALPSRNAGGSNRFEGKQKAGQLSKELRARYDLGSLSVDVVLRADGSLDEAEKAKAQERRATLEHRLDLQLA
jgi:hypothetical protein